MITQIANKSDHAGIMNVYKLIAIILLVLATTICAERVQCQQTWSCYGIDKSDERACSNHGTCTSADTCLCEHDIYYGNNCQYTGRVNTILAWGGGGQFGNSNYTEREQATPIEVDTSLMQTYKIQYVGGGAYHAVVLTEEGILFTWGASPEVGDAELTHTPIKMSLDAFMGKKVIKVESGCHHIIAMTEDMKLWAWGDNRLGQLAPMIPVSSTYTPLPMNTTIFEGETVIDFKTKGAFNLVWTTGNKLFFWGDSSIFIDGGTPQGYLTPVNTTELQDETISMIAVSAFNGFIVTSSNRIYGYGAGGSIGDGTSMKRSEPVLIDTSVLGSKIIDKIVCGLQHTLVLCTDGTIFGWGYSYINGTTMPLSPVMVDMTAFGAKKVVDIYAVGFVSMAKTSDGSIYIWGKQDYKLLGDGLDQHIYSPVLLNSMKDNISMINGYLTAYALSSTTTQCFGLYYSDIAHVCNGRGTCVARDVCICADGYSGINCQNTVCHNLTSWDVNVCSQRGLCIGPNKWKDM